MERLENWIGVIVVIFFLLLYCRQCEAIAACIVKEYERQEKNTRTVFLGALQLYEENDESVTKKKNKIIQFPM